MLHDSDRLTDGPTEAWHPLLKAAREIRTPCGDGEMVWRYWGAGRPLVLFHGGSGSWLHWLRNIPFLAAGRLVVVPDLPGLGSSELAPPPRTPESIAEVLAQGLDIVLGKGAACDFAGFSFGGLMAGHTAAARGLKDGIVVLVGPGGLGITRKSLGLVRVRGLEGWERVDAHRANLAQLMIADPDRIDPLALAIQDWNTRHARFDSRPLGMSDLLLSALPRIRMRIASIWGSRDASVRGDPREAEPILRGFQPDLDFKLIPGAGHWAAYEAADAFNAALVDILARDAFRTADRQVA